MAKNNYKITDSEGNEIIYYGCATVKDACELGQINVPADAVQNKAITLQEVEDSHIYNVTLKDELNVDYSENGQLIAYDDLKVWEGDFVPLLSPTTQKVGVLEITSTTQALGINENKDGYLLAPFQSLIDQQAVNTKTSDQQPGRIEIHLQSGQVILNKFSARNNSFLESPITGYEIIIQDFLESIDLGGTDLTIKELSIQDCLAFVDNEDENVNETSTTNVGEQIVTAEDNSWQLQAQINPALDAYSTFTNLNTDSQQTLSLKLSYTGEPVVADYGSILLAQIDMVLQYTYNGSKALSDLSVELWVDSGVLKSISKIDITNDFTVTDSKTGEIVEVDFAKSFLYTTRHNQELQNYTDELAAQFGGGKTVISHGYGTRADGSYIGWITYDEVPKTIGGDWSARNCSPLLRGNVVSLESVCIPEGVETIDDFTFYSVQLISCKFPNSLREIRQYAFYQTDIIEINFDIPNVTTEDDIHAATINLINNCFQYCDKLQSVIGGYIALDGGSQFSYCYNLKTFDVKSIMLGRVSHEYDHYPVYGNIVNNLPQMEGEYAFSFCEKLETDVCRLLRESYRHIGDRWWLPKGFLKNCLSMKSITLTYALVTRTLMESFYSSKYLSEDVFQNCRNVETIYISSDLYDALNGFQEGTFYGCTNVKHFYCNSDNPPYMGIRNINKKNAINPKTCQLYIPIGRTAAYRSKAQWGNFPKENIHELTQQEFEEVSSTL